MVPLPALCPLQEDSLYDLTPFLWGPVFEQLASNDDEFRKVRVDPDIGTISWPNGADIDPLVLHGDHEPAWRQTGASA